MIKCPKCSLNNLATRSECMWCSTSLDWVAPIKAAIRRCEFTLWLTSLDRVAPIKAAIPTQDVQEDTPKRREGVVYLIRYGLYHKIGKTINPNARYKQLNIQLPEKHELVHEIRTNNVDWLERHWHKHFKDKRANGEWFTLTQDDIAEFTNCNQIDVT